MAKKQRGARLKRTLCSRFPAVRVRDEIPSRKNGRRNWRRTVMLISKKSR